MREKTLYLGIKKRLLLKNINSSKICFNQEYNKKNCVVKQTSGASKTLSY